MSRPRRRIEEFLGDLRQGGGGDEDGDGIFTSAVCTVKVAVLEFDFKDGVS